MKAIHVITALILTLIVLSAGLFVIATAWKGAATWEQTLDFLKSMRIQASLVMLGVLLLLAVYAISAIKMPERVQYLAYDLEGGGAVSISLKAVQDFLSKIADEFAAVVSLHPTLKAVNGAVDVQLDVKVKSGAQIPELCRMLQDRVRESIKQHVGISDVKEVRVRVQEIVMTKASETIAPDSKSEHFT